MAGVVERFSDRGRTVISLAHREARRRLVPCVGADALFFELVKQADGVAAIVFRSFGVEVERVTREIEKLRQEAYSTLVPASEGRGPASPALRGLRLC